VTTIIQEHQGKITAEPIQPSGTCVTIDLPLMSLPGADTPTRRLTSQAHS
jgi:signal transduction histidine kinase